MKIISKNTLSLFYALYKPVFIFTLSLLLIFLTGLNAARAEISDLVKISYGAGPGQIGEPKTSGEVMIKNPQAICYDGLNSVYIADAVNQKIIKVNINDLKVSDSQNYSKTAFADKTIVDMAVIDNYLYLLTLKVLFKLSPDSQKCELAAKLGDKEQIRQPALVFGDGAGALALTDEYYENPQIVSFDKSGKIVKTTSLKSDEEIYNTYASDGASKFYANTIAQDGFSVFCINPKNIILNFKKDKAEKLNIFYANFIGFDQAKNIYCHVACSEAEGPVKANYIYKFSRDQKLVKKAVLPLPEEDEIALAKTFFIIKEDVLISYKKVDQGFALTEIIMK